jgi:hypothetical protein
MKLTCQSGIGKVSSLRGEGGLSQKSVPKASGANVIGPAPARQTWLKPKGWHVDCSSLGSTLSRSTMAAPSAEPMASASPVANGPFVVAKSAAAGACALWGTTPYQRAALHAPLK